MRMVATLSLLAVCAVGQEQLRVLGATIVYPEGRRTSALLYHDAYPEARARVRRVTGSLPPPGVTIELVEDTAALCAAIESRGGSAVPDWVAGVALPSQRLIIIRLDLRTPLPVRVKGLLIHELCHVVAHHVASGPDATPLPRWLDEGLAQHAEGRVFRADAPNLAMRAFFGQLLDLDALEDSFPRTEGASKLAYAQAESFVDWLARAGPPGDPLHSLLKALAEGRPFDRAVHDTYLRTLDDLESDWRAGLRSDRSWVPGAIGQLLLGALVVVGVVLGASRIVLRRRALLEKWEQEEPEVPDETDRPDDGWTIVQTPARPRRTGPRPRIRRVRDEDHPPQV